FQDGEYREAGARVEPSRDGALDGAAVVLKVQKPGADELDRIPEGCALIAYGLRAGTDLSQKLRDRRITALSLDLLPRIARAQSMDVLSSMANIAGYKGVLLGAGALGKFFPMLMTAAGTVLPARVLVLGAGVAGLQAIATGRRQQLDDGARQEPRQARVEQPRPAERGVRDGLPGLAALLAQRAQLPPAHFRQTAWSDRRRPRRRDRQGLLDRAPGRAAAAAAL